MWRARSAADAGGVTGNDDMAAIMPHALSPLPDRNLAREPAIEESANRGAGVRGPSRDTPEIGSLRLGCAHPCAQTVPRGPSHTDATRCARRRARLDESRQTSTGGVALARTDRDRRTAGAGEFDRHGNERAAAIALH